MDWWLSYKWKVVRKYSKVFLIGKHFSLVKEINLTLGAFSARMERIGFLTLKSIKCFSAPNEFYIKFHSFLFPMPAFSCFTFC